MRSLTVFSALVLSLSALAGCSAQSESAPPRGTDDTGGTSSSGAGATGFGGATSNNNGFSGSSNIAGTSSNGFGGSSNSGFGGASSNGFGGAPTGGAGAPSGSAGSAPASGSCAMTAVATGSNGMIDDFDMHPGSGLIPATDGRVGGWWISKSATGTVMPMANAAPVPVAGGDTGMGLHIMGSDTDLTNGWGADASVAITPTNGCYDASVYTSGIKVSLKGTGSIYLSVITAEDKAASATSGNQRKEIPITSSWADYSVAWSDLVTGWGNPIPLDLHEIVALDIAPSASSASNFDIWIDNLQFVK
jgi:hypothetical protein